MAGFNVLPNHQRQCSFLSSCQWVLVNHVWRTLRPGCGLLAPRGPVASGLCIRQTMFSNRLVRVLNKRFKIITWACGAVNKNRVRLGRARVPPGEED